MSALAAAITILAISTIAHLFITFGLVRRLRLHTELLNQLTQDNSDLLPENSPLPPFTADTIDGGTISHSELRHPGVLALLAVDCPHCRTNLPDFITYVHKNGYARDQVLAVVTINDQTDATARQHMLDALAPVATVVCESSAGGAITTALQVQAFPAFYLTHPDATLATGAHTVHNLNNTITHTPLPEASGT
ncbi:redoxin domain-containing protein [Streptomyces sp. NPDC056254]|uniref:redoxin domain-containing protein n=1 Tax=Streptomyces sp. NPDC056254 TaxID=3345763 RepID=UPI0035DAF5EE